MLTDDLSICANSKFVKWAKFGFRALDQLCFNSLDFRLNFCIMGQVSASLSKFSVTYLQTTSEKGVQFLVVLC